MCGSLVRIGLYYSAFHFLSFFNFLSMARMPLTQRPCSGRMFSWKQYQMILIFVQSFQAVMSLELHFAAGVFRHSIKSPSIPSSLKSYTKKPIGTPSDFGASTGLLTPHGYNFAVVLGTYYRTVFNSVGLVPATLCPAAKSVFAYVDTIERDNRTALGLWHGFTDGRHHAWHTFNPT